ncbi:hypothetical protein Athai_56120 [Actinocatenispora thailandica]|uniref:Carboxymuconolactone decarboxylase-like domain-containing protein n=1 Tax=Actinocatenispora thailandica TaxID=227318 RepID=A0A7R7DUJ8_9ACTN|nr:carboxymuconolactone decarboxylase family protein [Actinocatenispora thailandica]BCJ38109.1 hypothetical protein Athai_56120 [Actinocatenispora thailandica]
MTTSTEPDDVTSRLPNPGRYFPELGTVSNALAKITRNGAVPRATIGLVQLRAGQLVGSTYHTVRQTEQLRRAGEAEERITAVSSWRDAPYFTDAERVALELVEAVLVPNPAGRRVDDELYARAAAHYDERALWTLTLVIGQICLFIPVALIAQPIPGTPIGKNYRD